MPFVDSTAREIVCKTVYYGPGLGGKTTNVRHIHDRMNPSSRGRLLSLATETDRTLFFDFLPIELGPIRGYQARIQIYTVPGQVFYDASRKLILKGVDGVVFVADSRADRMEANLESLHGLAVNLREHGQDIRAIPYVLQFNKRDLADALPTAEMVRRLHLGREPVFEAVAVRGQGVFDTLRAIVKLVLLGVHGADTVGRAP